MHNSPSLKSNIKNCPKEHPKMYTNKFFCDTICTHLIDKTLLPKEIQIDEHDLFETYKHMVNMRCLEEQAYKNYKQHMRGFLHLTIGQESIYAAIKNCISNIEDDYDFIGSYRCHSLAYITGSPLQTIIYELLGRKDGMCKGKGGSMHLYNKNFYGGHGIVGAQVSLGTGLAFAIKYGKTVMGENNGKHAVFCFFGDGASNQGQVYESYNLALVHKLPIIYVIENNQYGMWTSSKDVNVTDNFYSRWAEMRAIRIRSNSFFVLQPVFEWVLKMVDEGPIVVQIDTYRHCGHAMNDDEKYRTQNEKEQEKESDCIEEIKRVLMQLSMEDDCVNAYNEINKNVAEMFENGLKCEMPSEDELYTDNLL